MRKSIRWRLQAWYALVLIGVVGGFAAILYSEARSSRFRGVDAELESAALFLDADLRRFPAHLLDGRAGAAPRGERPPRPPNMMSPDRLLAELNLPKEAGQEAGFYFGVWRGDGSLVKALRLPEGASAPLVAPTAGPLRPRMSSRDEFREAAMSGPQATRVLVGRSVRAELAAQRRFAFILAGSGIVTLAIGLLGGWIVSARVLAPIATIARAAAGISADNLSQRIDATKIDRELADLAAILNSMFERLEGAFERQAEFTADASHELRTPLAVIRTHAELALSRPREVPEYRATLKTCLKAAERMTSLVDGLLTLARADAGRLELRREPVELAPLVEEAIDQFRPLAAKKQIALKAELAPARVVGDPLRLGQVIANLLSNAVHYNQPGGEVRVTLAIERDNAVLEVSDTGIGIAPHHRARVFERFWRADKARTRASGGSGLGLAITRGLIEGHGGTIAVESDEGVGSTFRVRLPLGGDSPAGALGIR